MTRSCISYVIFIYLFLLLLLNTSTNSINILVISELCWILIYCAYASFSSLSGSLTARCVALPILVLAAVDCGVWLVILAHFDFFFKLSDSSLGMNSAKFLFRVKRLLQSNRYIK